MKSLKELRNNYLTLQVFVSGGTRIGHGSRIVYTEDCDGITLRGYTGDGNPCRLKVENTKLEDVLDSSGKPVEWCLADHTLRVNGVRVCPWGKLVRTDENTGDDDEEIPGFDPI